MKSAEQLVEELARLRGRWAAIEPRVLEIGEELSRLTDGQLVAAWNWCGLRHGFYACGGTRTLEMRVEYAWDGIGDWKA